ncbi:MAG: hypothetical protein EZS28_017842, partial [Streblomastix strix]
MLQLQSKKFKKTTNKDNEVQLNAIRALISKSIGGHREVVNELSPSKRRTADSRLKTGNLQKTSDLRHKISGGSGIPSLHLRIIISFLRHHSMISSKNQKRRVKFPTKISDFIKKQKEDALVFIEEEGLFEYYDDDCFVEAFYKIFMTEEGKQLEEELFNNIIALDLDETDKGMDSNEDYNVILFDNKLDSEIRTNDAQIIDKEKYCKDPMRVFEQAKAKNLSDDEIMTSFSGGYQFMKEDRLIYSPRKYLAAKNRTDLCPPCLLAEQIIMKIQRLKLKWADLSPIEREFLHEWSIHIHAASHQQEMLYHAIASVQPDSAVIIGDYKKNIKLDRKREEEGKKWFEKVPVSVLTFVAHIRLSCGKCIKR